MSRNFWCIALAAIGWIGLAPSVSGASVPTDAGSEKWHEFGREVYNFRCYYCHSYSGDAKTLASSFLTPRPRDFTADDLKSLPRERILDAVRNGRPGTAMKPFGDVLSDRETDAVVDFVVEEFLRRRSPNTHYHTAEAGWPDHERYASAFPFATGEIALDTPWGQLSPDQARGKQLFLNSCISCHDRARVGTEGEAWAPQALSFPRNGYDHRVPGGRLDAVTSASFFTIHDQRPKIDRSNNSVRRGEAVYQENCAFCHAADGTGRNWIGTFMEPHARDLTDPTFMTDLTRTHLRLLIEDGVENTSMPAWKNVLSETQIEQLMDYIAEAFHPLANSGQNLQPTVSR